MCAAKGLNLNLDPSIAAQQMKIVSLIKIRTLKKDTLFEEKTTEQTKNSLNVSTKFCFCNRWPAGYESKI